MLFEKSAYLRLLKNQLHFDCMLSTIQRTLVKYTLMLRGLELDVEFTIGSIRKAQRDTNP